MNFCMVLTENFQVYAWGDNSFGNVGTGDLDYQYVPQLVSFDENKRNSKIAFISCGSNHAAAISVTGKMYTWG